MLRHITILFLLAFTTCGPTVESTQYGLASYYANFFHGQKTASGMAYDSTALTAAHRELPFGSKVRVTNTNNQLQTIVVINDRGPYYMNRIIDLSKQAARELSMVTEGVVRVKLEVISE